MNTAQAPEGLLHALLLDGNRSASELNWNDAINVGGIPGVENSVAFWVVVVLCVALMLVLAVVFRWKKWL